MNTYQKVLDYLYEQLPMFQRIGAAAFKKDLSNTIALCKALNHPEQKFKSIHIAGTNGKGSVTHIIAAILQEAGFKVGCYTSPHYKDFRERIKINGQLVSEAFVVDFVNKNLSTIESIKPSFFEITVAMAFEYFAQEKVDIAVIETGMGGRLDSTNVILPELSVITNISYDHQQFLGETLPEIAGEKAGIIKPGVPVIIGEHQQEVVDVFSQKAKETNSPLYFSSEICEVSEFKSKEITSHFMVNSHFINGQLSTDLLGGFQQKNLQTAIAAAIFLRDKFNISAENIANALKNIRTSTYFLGRCMILQNNPLCLADSAHNEGGIKELIKIINNISHNKLHFVYGTVSDKDLNKVFPLLPSNAQFYLCKPDIPRGMNAHELWQKATSYGLKAEQFSSVNKAFQAALSHAEKDDLIVVSGSIFVVAEVI